MMTGTSARPGPQAKTRLGQAAFDFDFRLTIDDFRLGTAIERYVYLNRKSPIQLHTKSKFGERDNGCAPQVGRDNGATMITIEIKGADLRPLRGRSEALQTFPALKVLDVDPQSGNAMVEGTADPRPW